MILSYKFTADGSDGTIYYDTNKKQISLKLDAAPVRVQIQLYLGKTFEAPISDPVPTRIMDDHTIQEKKASDSQDALEYRLLDMRGAFLPEHDIKFNMKWFGREEPNGINQ